MDGGEGVEAGLQNSHVDEWVPTFRKDGERDCGTAG